MEAIEAKKDQVLAAIESDAERRRDEMLAKAWIPGTELSELEREKLLNHFNSNIEKIGDMLLDDEARQAGLLKMRLEERKLRRKKL